MNVSTAIKLLLISTSIISVLTIPLNINDKDKTNNEISDEDLSQDEEKKLVFERYIKIMLEKYFDDFIAPTLQERNLSKSMEKKNGSTDYAKLFEQHEDQTEEKMMADLPATEAVSNTDSENLKNLVASLNKNNSNVTNSFANSIGSNANREKNMEGVMTESVKKQWLMFIQKNILERTGRANNMTSVPPFTEPVVWILNRTGTVQMPAKGPETETDNEEYLDKKIRSFYPSCDVPRNTDEEAWKDANTMNLFFNVDYNSGSASVATPDQQPQEETVNIASATLRLYRLPQETNATVIENCQKGTSPHSISDDDKQIRVSVYWYSRSLKKHKVAKRRLADSRMVPMYEPRQQLQQSPSATAHYVEFNVRPAAKTWVRGRNLGLGVVVEDVDGGVLNAARFFKGVACDTPRPFQFPPRFSTPTATPLDLDELLTVLSQLPALTIRACPT